MRVTQKGQVTIPREIRDKAGILPETEVDFVLEGDRILIKKRKNDSSSRGRRLLRRMRGKATVSIISLPSPGGPPDYAYPIVWTLPSRLW